MTTAWSYLPNAAHIDRVIASVTAHPAEWAAERAAVGDAVGAAAWGAAWEAARDAAWEEAWRASREAAWRAAREATWPAAWKAAGSAIVALIAWDHSAQYLSMPSKQLEMWAILSEDPACILLLPAVRHLN